MNRWTGALLAVLFAAGCVDNSISLVFLQSQAHTRTNMCVVSNMESDPKLSKGILDVGLVEDGFGGYEMFPLVRNNQVDRSNPMAGVAQRGNIQINGAEVQLVPFGPVTLTTGQTSYFSPSAGGNVAPGQTGVFGFTAIPRTIALMLAQGISGTEADFPTVIVRFRVVGTHPSDTGDQEITSAWIDFPVELCRHCLTGPIGDCGMGFKPETVSLGSCNPAQDEGVTCCTSGLNLLCGPAVPTTTM